MTCDSAFIRTQSVRIRPAGAGEAAKLRQIERMAAELFRDIGLDRVCLDAPTDEAVLQAAARDGRLLTADVVANGRIIDEAAGFLLSGCLDGQPHIQELSVKPARSRMGIGRQMIEAFDAQSAARNAYTNNRSHNRRITLTTFREVPWNAPYYRRLGFEVIAAEKLGPALAECLAKERARFPAAEFGERVAMSRPIRSQ